MKGREGKETGEGTLIMNPKTSYVTDGMDKNAKFLERLSSFIHKAGVY